MSVRSQSVNALVVVAVPPGAGVGVGVDVSVKVPVGVSVVAGVGVPVGVGVGVSIAVPVAGGVKVASAVPVDNGVVVIADMFHPGRTCGWTTIPTAVCLPLSRLAGAMMVTKEPTARVFSRPDGRIFKELESIY